MHSVVLSPGEKEKVQHLLAPASFPFFGVFFFLRMCLALADLH